MFSSLLKKAGSEIALNEVAKKVADAADRLADAAEKAAAEAKAEAPEKKAAPALQPKPAAQGGGASAGLSWGEEMPSEENQFNFKGNFVEYFEHIFAEDFPAYSVEKEIKKGFRGAVLTLTQGGKKSLVVELMSEGSCAQRVRKACAAEGVPYLRFYHDHHGWWNTRSYVSGRIRKALA